MGLRWANFTRIPFKQDYCKSLEKTENIPMVNLVSIEDIYEVKHYKTFEIIPYKLYHIILG